MTKEFGKSFMLYKARNSGDGAASQFSLSSKKDCVFLEMANQVGRDDNDNAKFDWSNKIVFKLDEADIGEILSTLVEMQQAIGPFDPVKNKHKGLYHSNKHGNAILYLGKDEHQIFRIRLSTKRGEVKKVVQHTFTKGEACILSTLLRRAIEVMYMWD